MDRFSDTFGGGACCLRTCELGGVTPRPTVTLGGTALTACDGGGVTLEIAELGGVILL